MKQLFFYCIIITVMATTACKKSGAEITQTSQVAANAQSEDMSQADKKIRKGFTAKINRVRWVSNGLKSDSTAIPGPAYYGSYGIDSSLVLVGYGSFPGYEQASYAYILLFVNGFKGPGVYPMGEYRGTNSFGVFTSVYEDGTFDQFYSGESSGTLNITSYDEVNNTISGDFNFSAISSTDGNIIIKDGLFAGLQLQ
ncbi:MAG TPA: DUF6252 family protein [Panacibacter sp.]|nr:DUF6252 family protein [Panacibacter sp.]